MSAPATPRERARWTSRRREATGRWPICSLEVSPQHAKRRKRGERRRFSAQHARAEAGLDEPDALERRLLLGGEAGFRPGREGGLGLHAHFADGAALSGEQQSRTAAARVPEVIGKVDEGPHFGDAIAAALLAGGDDHPPPVLDARVRALALQLDHALLRQD